MGASTITLGGLLKHLAYVEDYWFSQSLHGRAKQPPWDTVDWKADPDWEWHSAAEDSPEQLFALWQEAAERVPVACGRSPGARWPGAARPAYLAHGEAPSLRWILVHMIEEYARHNGHADLIREVGGRVGGGVAARKSLPGARARSLEPPCVASPRPGRAAWPVAGRS